LPASSEEGIPHSPEEITRIVLKGACGFESVAEICRQENISPSLYYSWRRDFVRACRTWAQEHELQVAIRAEEDGLGSAKAADDKGAAKRAGFTDLADRLTTSYLSNRSGQA
jgi:transposase-like protein